VTGQRSNEITNLDVLPPSGEGSEVLLTPKGRASGPNVVGLQAGPERYCQEFKAGCGSDNRASGFILDGDDLNSKVTDGECTYVHQPVFAAAGFRLVVEGEEGTVSTVPNVGAEPHLDVHRNAKRLSKQVPRVSIKKR